MIKKFINKLLGKTEDGAAAPKAKKTNYGKREEIGVAVHGIDVKLVDNHAMNVVRTLKDAGFEGYIVGGAVRDLLVGLRPKDFDVATDATPEQVKQLFRRAFIIGRRFRIVHVVYGRGREHEVIEVTTFRANLDNAAAEQVKGNEKTSKSELAGMKHAVDSSGRVLRDNVWGTQQEDAVRRDFTINAMYYDPDPDPAKQIVVDYHGGYKDAKKRVIRMIGDAAARYREDPVRIIRAVRFAAKLAKLGFKLDAKTSAPLTASQKLLADVPQSRLFDEMLKLLQTGHAQSSIATLKELGLAKGIYPLLDVVVERADQTLVRVALEDTDRRVGEGKPVVASFLLACVLWADVRDGWAQRQNPRNGQRQHSFPALQEAIDDVFNARIGDVSGRGKLAADMREIWMMQPRFEKRVGSTPFGMVDQPRFRASFDFMRLRAQAGEVDESLAEWWQEFSIASDEQREDMVADIREVLREEQRQQQKNKPKTTSKQRPATPKDGKTANSPLDNLLERTVEDRVESGDESAAPTNADPAKKRRRRKRGGAKKPNPAFVPNPVDGSST
jgi:poly(A) polymerase